jgi:hypothetical protein
MHLNLVGSAALLLSVSPLALSLPVDRIRDAVDSYLEERANAFVYGVYTGIKLMGETLPLSKTSTNPFTLLFVGYSKYGHPNKVTGSSASSGTAPGSFSM